MPQIVSYFSTISMRDIWDTKLVFIESYITERNCGHRIIGCQFSVNHPLLFAHNGLQAITTSPKSIPPHQCIRYKVWDCITHANVELNTHYHMMSSVLYKGIRVHSIHYLYQRSCSQSCSQNRLSLHITYAAWEVPSRGEAPKPIQTVLFTSWIWIS